MMLIRLTYFSRNRLNLWNGNWQDGIAEVLATSAANNLRDEITGVLVCDDRWFAQVLEGTENKVSVTFERILRDTRHSDVTLVTMQTEAERRYPDCPMLGVIRNEDNGDLFRHYGEHDGFDPRTMRADRLSDLIDEVVRRDATTGGQSWGARSNMSAA
jgi:hypothetical protein